MLTAPMWVTAQASAVSEITGLSGRDLGLTGLVAVAVSLIFLGWLVPYRLVRRTDYERVMALLEAAQATNATNAETMKASADKKDLSTALVEAIRAEVGQLSTTDPRGANQQEDPA